MSDEELRRRDEVLQIMYWFRGEKLGEEVNPEQIARLSQLAEPELRETLGRLVDLRLVEPGGEGYRLTPQGVEEGKRRFLDEFSGYLGKESHFECNDPDCDCHSPAGAGCHSRRTS